ncbi:MAG: hypothetical protein JWR69_610 [Pedosphaera sp.]|nr:hypothetical protein [Pedosphaera sp.]
MTHSDPNAPVALTNRRLLKMKTKTLLCSLLAATLGSLIPSTFAAPYTFIEGYTVLDETTSPGIGSNLGQTCAAERDIAVDSARNIIYIGRGNIINSASPTDGRSTTIQGLAAIVIANNANGAYTDTGLIVAAANQPALSFHQALAYDPTADKLFVFGGGAVATPVLFSAPGGTLGGAPAGGDTGATNGILLKEFQVATNQDSAAASTTSRGGTPRNLAIRTSGGVTTAYLAMGNHAQAWSNDEGNLASATYPWRRLWDTLRFPLSTNVNNRVATGGSSVNGIAVDDEGNCFVNQQNGVGGAHIWMVPANVASLTTNLQFLDFADRAIGGTNTSVDAVVLPLIPQVASGLDNGDSQGITYFRAADGRKGLFVSDVNTTSNLRGITRWTFDNQASTNANGAPFLGAVILDGLGANQPASGQDTILKTMRLKTATAGQTQPGGTGSGSNILLYNDVNSITNPSVLYFSALVTDTNKGQTIPTACLGKIAIPALPAAPSVPAVVNGPQSQTAFQGAFVTFSVTATGFGTLKYQWKFNDTNLNTTNIIANATNSSLLVTNLQFTNAGNYFVVVTNTFGATSSTNAVLTIVPSLLTGAQSSLWSLAPGNRTYLANDDAQRGLAYNPVSGNVLIISRTPTNGVHILNSTNGADLGTLNVSVVSQGTYLLNMIGVADDGAVYAANLSLAQSGDQTFKIYRWADDSTNTIPTLAYADSPLVGRIGDTLAVRGSGANTEILAASRNGTQVVLFNTADGVNFNANTIDVTTAPAGGFAGLGLAFGKGETFWAKSSGFFLRQVAFDLNAGTNGIINAFTNLANTVINIGVDTSNDLLAGIANRGTTPDNLELFDIQNLSNEPVLLDQDFFATGNFNGNATGSVAFDVAGGRIFALDSDNGIAAFKVVARLHTTPSGNSVTFTWTGPSALQSATTLTGPWTNVPGAASGYTIASPTSTVFYRLAR